jgi:hypothetical protein
MELQTPEPRWRRLICLSHYRKSEYSGTWTKANAEDDPSVRIDIKGRLTALCFRTWLCRGDCW